LTHQNRETFIHKGEELQSHSQPLRSHPNLPEFLPLGSFCWRGYNGTWSIKNEKLYLVDLYAHIPHPTEVNIKQCLRYDLERDDFYYETVHEPVAVKATLKDVFPEAGKDGLSADWFTGNINFGQGDITLRGMHNRYDKYLSLRFENGVLAEERVLTYDEAYAPEPEELP
jgi:hypothetical protein